MKTFAVQGYNWIQNYEVDDSLFDSYEDMAFEAMTLALEEYMTFPTENPVWHSSCEADTQNLAKEFGEWGDGFKREKDELLDLTWITTAWEKGNEKEPDKKIAALTELVLRNCGHHELANDIRARWLKARKVKK